MNKYKFGEFIYNKRKALGLTQDELGRALGVTNKAVSKWETGETLPDVQLLQMLASALNVTIDELITQEAPKVEVKYLEPKKSIFKPIAIILGIIMLITILLLCISLIPEEKTITTANILDYYDINACESSKIDGDTITINGVVDKRVEVSDTNIKLSLTIKYYYVNTDDAIAEILYLNREAIVNEECMSFSLTLAPKNEINNFKSFYGFDISYKVIEVTANVS